jgi:hypothetical protein
MQKSSDLTVNVSKTNLSMRHGPDKAYLSVLQQAIQPGRKEEM